LTDDLKKRKKRKETDRRSSRSVLESVGGLLFSGEGGRDWE
jgi:hypothetical protein